MKIRTLAAAAAAVLALAGCSNMETAPDEQGIRYSGGLVFAEAVEFKSCQLPSTQEYGGAGDNTYTYPAGQRTFKFSADAGSDAPPITVSAPAPGGGQPISMAVSGTVTFTPNFADCDALRAFHERIGLKYQAWTADGWATMIGVYIKDPIDQAADNAALASNWVALTSDAAAKQRWQDAVTAAVQGTPSQPGAIERLAGGPFFRVDTVLLSRPELPVDIQAAIATTEKARQEAATAAEVKRAAESFPGGVTAYQDFQRQQAINEAIRRSDGVKVLPVPQGSPIIVNPGG